MDGSGFAGSEHSTASRETRPISRKQGGIPPGHLPRGDGPLYDNCDYWLRKVKAALDPNSVADWLAYIPAEYPDESTPTNEGSK